jgi:hypothetical protein
MLKSAITPTTKTNLSYKIDEIQQTIDSYSGLIGRNQAIEIICKRGKPNVYTS